MKILVTGTAGFIGASVAEKLLERGDTVVGLDNINDYYDVNLKYGRLARAGVVRDDIEYGKFALSDKYGKYKFIKLGLEDKKGMEKLFKKEGFDAVCNLGAQAGVRYSLINPDAYIESNIVGFMNILEGCRHNGVKNLSYASSSSVYGLNSEYPFKTEHNVDHPVSLYAATKKSNELLAHTYSYLYDIHTTGLRFFTVYGPWGRPDMALFLFTKAALDGKPIDVFNNGDMMRDFTYIDDIVEGVVRVIDNPSQADESWDHKDPSSSSAPYKVYNIGNSKPVRLMDFISAIENRLDMTIEKNFMPMQPGDVKSTYADVTGLSEDMGYKPNTPVQEGVNRFIDWYLDYYKISC